MFVLGCDRQKVRKYAIPVYEGHSINKLQNDIILLILKIRKFGNIHFVENLIGDIYWNCYDDTSLLWRHLYLEHSQSVQYFAQQFSFYNSQVLNSVAPNEKNEQIQQANVFKCQTLTLHFSTHRTNSLNMTSHTSQTVWENRLLRLLHQSLAIRSFLINTLSWPWANFLYQTCIAGLVNTCRHTLGASETEWHLHQVFRPQKTNNRTLFVMGHFQRQRSFIQCL